MKEMIIGRNRVTVTINKGKSIVLESELTKKENGHIIFSQCGTGNKVGSGQIQSIILEKYPEITDSKIMKMWLELHKKWHLNDLHAGTAEQEKAVKYAQKKGIINQRYDYTEACNYLASVGLLRVMYRGKPYKYGSGWLYRPISKKDLELMKKYMKGSGVYEQEVFFKVNNAGKLVFIKDEW